MQSAMRMAAPPDRLPTPEIASVVIAWSLPAACVDALLLFATI
jgi:hypothetical protein